MTAAIAVIIAFMLMSSGRNDRRTFWRYVPPMILRMNNAWKINRPNEKPATYSTM